MQIVIDIAESRYRLLQTQARTNLGREKLDEFAEAVLDGTPLPKGHGRLKDEDEIVKAIEDRVEFLRKNDAVFMRLRKDIDILGCIPKIRCEVSTIIEADKEKV